MIQTLADALEKRGYTDLTPVQEAVTNPELGDADLLVSAQTGSGKTVGFGLAMAPTLLGDEERFPPADIPLALVIAPTRELALQVKRELAWLYANTGAVVASCVGGMDPRDERRALERGAHMVVATPGRLCDHIRRGAIDLTAVRAVVLDEADEMLDLGFKDDLEYILSEAPEDRRTLLFSATVPRGIASLAKKYQRDAVRVSTTEEKAQHSDIEYRALTVAPRDVENAVINVLRYYEAKNALVFCNTRAAVARLTTRFSNRGFAVVALSGELSQTERSHALQAMRDGRARVCVATDVAARGIDLPNLDLVVHADLPTNAETLLHRSGRTGRAGRKGVSAIITPLSARKKTERLLGWAKVKAEWAAPPSAEEVTARDEERLLTSPVWDEPLADSERDFVTKLTDSHSAEAIASAFIRLYRDRQSAPEELAPVRSDAPPAGREPREPREPRAPRGDFGPSRWISVSLGREQRAEAKWLLPMICRSGDIEGKAIGAIRIRDKDTFVEIADNVFDGFIAKIGPDRKLEAGVTLTVENGPPPPDARSDRDAPRDDRKPDRKPFRKDKEGRRDGPDSRYKDGDKDKKPRKGPPPHKGDRDDKPKGGKPYSDKPRDDKPRSDKPRAHKPGSDKPYAGKPKAAKSDRPYKPEDATARPAKPKPEGRDKAPRPFQGDPTDTSRRPPGAKSKTGGKPRTASSKKPAPKARSGNDVMRRPTTKPRKRT